ncbi:RecX family transcriptional regulator [Aerococcaceae bacterium NML190938]|nr:RecX family transcriptional regulator [Aerococcaceae bacterium NML190938]MCW6679697.1 RecX family transcriptional regulator [Aerococcaceae bacterium NML130460]
MQITKIEHQKKDKERYSLYIDGEFAFGVSEATLIQFGLYRSQPIDEAKLLAIKEAEAGQRVYAKAVNYLSYGLRTEQELRIFLQKKLEDIEDVAMEEKIDAAIERLRQQGYVDDIIYAQSFVRDAALITRKGPYIIRQDLAKKGVAPIDIDKGLAEYSEAQQEENLLYLANKFMRTKGKFPPKMLEMKLKQFLLMKGYTQALVEQVVARLSFEIDEEIQFSQLASEAEKLYRKRRAKYTGKQLLYKVREGLYQKGYDSELISQWMDDNEEMFLE